MDIYSAIAEPNRRKILDALQSGEKPVTALVQAVGMSQPVVSKHLRTLRDAGLVEVKPQGQQRLYRIRHQPMRELAEWLAPYEKFWNERLDDLDEHLNAEAEKQRARRSKEE